MSRLLKQITDHNASPEGTPELSGRREKIPIKRLRSEPESPKPLAEIKRKRESRRQIAQTTHESVKKSVNERNSSPELPNSDGLMNADNSIHTTDSGKRTKEKSTEAMTIVLCPFKTGYVMNPRTNKRSETGDCDCTFKFLYFPIGKNDKPVWSADRWVLTCSEQVKKLGRIGKTQADQLQRNKIYWARKHLMKVHGIEEKNLPNILRACVKNDLEPIPGADPNWKKNLLRIKWKVIKDIPLNENDPSQTVTERDLMFRERMKKWISGRDGADGVDLDGTDWMGTYIDIIEESDYKNKSFSTPALLADAEIDPSLSASKVSPIKKSKGVNVSSNPLNQAVPNGKTESASEMSEQQDSFADENEVSPQGRRTPSKAFGGTDDANFIGPEACIPETILSPLRSLVDGKEVNVATLEGCQGAAPLEEPNENTTRSPQISGKRKSSSIPEAAVTKKAKRDNGVPDVLQESLSLTVAQPKAVKQPPCENRDASTFDHLPSLSGSVEDRTTTGRETKEPPVHHFPLSTTMQENSELGNHVETTTDTFPDSAQTTNFATCSSTNAAEMMESEDFRKPPNDETTEWLHKKATQIYQEALFKAASDRNRDGPKAKETSNDAQVPKYKATADEARVPTDEATDHTPIPQAELGACKDTALSSITDAAAELPFIPTANVQTGVDAAQQLSGSSENEDVQIPLVPSGNKATFAEPYLGPNFVFDAENSCSLVPPRSVVQAGVDTVACLVGYLALDVISQFVLSTSKCDTDTTFKMFFLGLFLGCFGHAIFKEMDNKLRASSVYAIALKLVLELILLHPFLVIMYSSATVKENLLLVAFLLVFHIASFKHVDPKYHLVCVQGVHVVGLMVSLVLKFLFSS